MREFGKVSPEKVIHREDRNLGASGHEANTTIGTSVWMKDKQSEALKNSCLADEA